MKPTTRRLLSVLCTILCFLYAAGASTKIQEPDFAYPQTVSKNAEVALKKALSANDGQATVRALADMALAQLAIGKDELPVVVNRIEEVRNSEQQPVTYSLLSMLLADIYTDIYTSDKYIYDRRETPFQPRPTAYDEWNGEQFRARIDSLCTDALQNPGALQTAMLANYATIVKASRETLVYYPTLFDFACQFVINTRQQLTPFSGCLPLIFLSQNRVFAATPIVVPSSTGAAAVLDVFAGWLKFHQNNVAPLINADIRRINFVESSLYPSLGEEGESRRIKLLESLYRQYANSQYSGDVLIAISDTSDPSSRQEKERREFFRWLETNIAKYPSFDRIGCLKQILTSMKAQRGSVSTPSSVAPGRDFAVRVRSTNAQSTTVDLYAVEPGTDLEYNYRFGTGSQRLVKSITIATPGIVPYDTDTAVNVSLETPGYYIATVRDSRNKPSSCTIIRCSDFAIGASTLFDEALVYAVNPAGGTPLSGVTILKSPSNRKQISFKEIGKTANGIIKTEMGGSYIIKGECGADHYSQPIYISGSRPREYTDTAVAVFSNLAIYHPGDTVRWVAVVYNYNYTTRHPLKAVVADATLRMPNGEKLTETATTTDDFGRAEGVFVLPKEGLTGNATITIKCGKRSGSARVMVSDYKLPTFATEVTGVDRTDSMVMVRGKARTYSGVAVSGASVTLNISAAQPMWWSRSNFVQFYSAGATTDGEGNWKFELPKEIFEYSPAPKGIYSAEVTVTSAAGESRQCRKEFTLCPTYTIESSISGCIDISAPVRLNIRVLDGESRPTNRSVNYALVDNSADTVVSGTIMSFTPDVDWSNIAPGRYTISLRIDAEQQPTTNSVILYLPSGSKSPVSDPLWSPGDGCRILTDKNRKAKILYATPAETSYVLYTLSSAETGKIYKTEWLKCNKGMHTLEVKLPDDIDEATVSLTSTLNFQSTALRFKIVNPNSLKKISIVAESFRDKIIPGANEKWTFRTVDKDSAGMQSAMMLSMFNSALSGIDGLYIEPWQLNPASIYRQGISQTQPALEGQTCYSFFNSTDDRFACKPIIEPTLNLYGRSFHPMMIRGTMQLTSRALGAKMMMDAVGATQMKMESVVEYEAAAVSEESTADTGASEDPKQTEQPFSYRQSEVPLAIFAPMLTTDSQGRLTYSFTTPNANTTWSFRALAYDKDIISASIEREVVANKPVMVQPNLPRFVRCGDVVTIRSNVMNNTSQADVIAVKAEVFDVVSSTVTASYDTTMTIAADGAGVFAITLSAPLDAPFIGFRVKATNADGYSDGEQSIIAVLPFTTPVIDTKPFYMAPDSTRLSFQLPRMNADARVTLQFCENPTWYVATALPGLRNSELRTAPDAASAIFSAAVAEGIIKNYPEIRSALDEWTSSKGDDSTLVSMLSLNQDLKTMLLEATPWMLDAQSDTERMQRLALLFDKDEIVSVNSKSIALLGRQQQSDGGFAWQESYPQSSEWATQTVVTLMGRLNRMGWLPENKELRAMLTKAIAYVEKETIKAWRKYPKGDYTYYAVLTDLWPGFKFNQSTRQLKAAVVQRLIGGWKKLSVGAKAQAALLLYRNGHKAVARQILASLRQYAKLSPTQGLWWPSVGDAMSGSMSELTTTALALEAFAEIEPTSSDIDSIRQWLILQKETRSWGDGASASQVIASILSTSKKWIVPAQGSIIRVGDRLVEPENIEKRLGYFRTPISDFEPSGKILTIEKKGLTPAWGAVYCQYTSAMTAVEPEKCEALSIEKSYLKEEDDKWVEAKDFSVGDRIKVMLTVKASRALQYVVIRDDRAACLEPMEQLPTPLWSEGLCFYRENRDSYTTMFVSQMPKGVYLLSYDMWVNNAGVFTSGIASAQSQYAPQISAHSGGSLIRADE